MIKINFLQLGSVFCSFVWQHFDRVEEEYDKCRRWTVCVSVHDEDKITGYSKEKSFLIYLTTFIQKNKELLNIDISVPFLIILFSFVTW